MAKLTLKARSSGRADLIKAAESKERAVRDWSDGKVSSAQRDKVVAAANEKLRGA